MNLIYPERRYLESYKKAFLEYKTNKVNTYDFLNTDEIDVIKYTKDLRNGMNLPEGYVPSTYLWLVEKDEFLAEVNIRHTLNENLERLGGHIGYGVSYENWRKGYGTYILSEALKFANQKYKINKFLITCNDDNKGSIKVIEKNKGLLQDKIVNEYNGKSKLTRRYIIEYNK